MIQISGLISASTSVWRDSRVMCLYNYEGKHAKTDFIQKVTSIYSILAQIKAANRNTRCLKRPVIG